MGKIGTRDGWGLGSSREGWGRRDRGERGVMVGKSNLTIFLNCNTILDEFGVDDDINMSDK